MIENDLSIAQVASIAISAWLAKETLVAVLKSLFGVTQNLSDTEKTRARVMARLTKKRI